MSKEGESVVLFFLHFPNLDAPRTASLTLTEALARTVFKEAHAKTQKEEGDQSYADARTDPRQTTDGHSDHNYDKKERMGKEMSLSMLTEWRIMRGRERRADAGITSS